MICKLTFILNFVLGYYRSEFTLEYTVLELNVHTILQDLQVVIKVWGEQNNFGINHILNSVLFKVKLCPLLKLNVIINNNKINQILKKGRSAKM